MQAPRELSTPEREDWSLGRQSFERGEVEPALHHLGRLAETRTGFADVHYMLGLLHERRGDLAAAACALERAIQINPNYAEAVLALGSVYEQRNEYERARDLAGSLRVVGPGDPAGITAQARTSATPDGPARALDPTTQGKLANLQAAVGDAYREAGELRDAIDAYRRALDRCPQFHDIRLRLGVALREAGLPAQAVAELRRVQRSAPDPIGAGVQLGVTYYGMGRVNDAVREWTAALARDPGRADARLYLRLVKARLSVPSPAPGPVFGEDPIS
jgi:tetratricopeptide (TPR) repeat protein